MEQIMTVQKPILQVKPKKIYENYDPKFQLYLQTKLSNPHYKPEIFAQCTLIRRTIISISCKSWETKKKLVRSINEYMHVAIKWFREWVII